MTNIIFSKNQKPEDVEFLTEKINQENQEIGSAFPFGFFIYDDANNIVAGANGSVIFGAIYTDQLWVDPTHRRQGLGTRLMEAVHTYGREQKCRIATVNTMDFQHARSFYEKLGYQVDFERKGYAQNSACFFLKMTL